MLTYDCVALLCEKIKIAFRTTDTRKKRRFGRKCGEKNQYPSYVIDLHLSCCGACPKRAPNSKKAGERNPPAAVLFPVRQRHYAGSCRMLCHDYYQHHRERHKIGIRQAVPIFNYSCSSFFFLRERMMSVTPTPQRKATTNGIHQQSLRIPDVLRLAEGRGSPSPV